MIAACSLGGSKAVDATSLVSPELKHVAHTLTLMSDLVLVGYIAWKLWKGRAKLIRESGAVREANFNESYGPFATVIIGGMLLIVDPVRHFLGNYHLVQGQKVSMYRADMSLSPIGWVGLVTSWVGLASLFFGIFWHLQIKRSATKCKVCSC